LFADFDTSVNHIVAQPFLLRAQVEATLRGANGCTEINLKSWHILGCIHLAALHCIQVAWCLLLRIPDV
jgi:hypothetical protein